MSPVRPATARARATWHRRADQLPDLHLPPTPFHTQQWAQAWQYVHTEPVLYYRHLNITHGPATYRLPFHLIDAPPLWRAMELGAGVAEPAWRGPVLMAPSVYGEYGGLPGAPAAVIEEAVEHGLALAAELRADALVIPNLPPADRQAWSDARQPDAEVTLFWAHRASTAGGIDGFLQRMPNSKQGRSFRRQWRRGHEAGLSLRVAHGDDIREVLGEFTKLATATAERHGINLYGDDIFIPLTRVPGAVLLAARHHGRLAGAFLCFLYEGTLYLWAAGIDHGSQHDLHTYGWLMYESVRYAAEHGARTLDAGRSNYAYKAKIGLHRTPLTSAIYLPFADPELTGRLERLDAALHEQVQQAWPGR